MKVERYEGVTTISWLDHVHEEDADITVFFAEVYEGACRFWSMDGADFFAKTEGLGG